MSTKQILDNRKKHLAIVVALPCEAKFFIKTYQLKQKAQKPFLYYKNIAGDLHLLVTGVGPIHAAAAFGHLTSLINVKRTLFINVGIAGAKEEPLGALFEINKLVDASSDKYYYPNFETKSSRTLITSAKPTREYSQDSLHDMEGAAFFQAASLFTTHENIRLYKIVSDNVSAGTDLISSKHVLALFEKNTFKLERLLASASEHLVKHELNLAEGDITGSLRFSEYQRHELKEFLRRFKIHHPDIDPRAFLPGCKAAGDFLLKIRIFLQEETDYVF